MKSEVQSLLFEFFLEHGEAHVAYSNTRQVFAAKKYKKDELIISMGQCCHHRGKQSQGLATKDSICAQVTPPRCDLKKAEGTFAPYFHVKPQHLEEGACNMEKVVLKTNDACIPYLRNKRALEIGKVSAHKKTKKK